MNLKPAIPRHILLLLASIFWALAGLILCIRAIGWLEVIGTATLVVAETLSLAVAVIAYVFWFSRLVVKNITRIRHLPERACAFAFTAWHGYLMIGLMMTLGITLRNTSIPRIYLAIPYAVMGGVLIGGSIKLCREFLGGRPAGPLHRRADS